MTGLSPSDRTALGHERRRGQGTRGINGRGPRSGRATVYAAKALDADAAATLSWLGVRQLLPRPLPRGERGVAGQRPASR